MLRGENLIKVAVFLLVVLGLFAVWYMNKPPESEAPQEVAISEEELQKNTQREADEFIALYKHNPQRVANVILDMEEAMTPAQELALKIITPYLRPDSASKFIERALKQYADAALGTDHHVITEYLDTPPAGKEGITDKHLKIIVSGYYRAHPADLDVKSLRTFIGEGQGKKWRKQILRECLKNIPIDTKIKKILEGK